jgi:hypothetical protein
MIKQGEKQFEQAANIETSCGYPSRFHCCGNTKSVKLQSSCGIIDIVGHISFGSNIHTAYF